jgi:hypothetical protein
MNIKELGNAYRAFVKEDKRQYRRHKKLKCGSDFTICSKGARWLRHHFFPQAKIMGYSIDDNPTALLGTIEGGHDFLLVDDRYLIDFWPRRTIDRSYPIAYDLCTQPSLVHHYYGNPATWQKPTN